jgi:hypothetical protein
VHVLMRVSETDQVERTLTRAPKVES